jgi:hypothetical protein
VPGIRLALTVLATIATTLLAQHLMVPSANAGDRDAKSACCFKLDGSEASSEISQWMATQVSHGHSNFEVVPVGKTTTLCGW